MKLSKFRRSQRPQRAYKKIAHIVCEGQTERNYFNKLRTLHPSFVIKVIDNKKASDAKSLLKIIQNESMADGDIAAIVIDKDDRTLKELKPLIDWQKPGEKYLCLSVPQFEYWLLLHKTNCAGISNRTDCERAMKRFFPGYKKPNVPAEVFEITALHGAIAKAKLDLVPGSLKDSLPLKGTNLYNLLERLFKDS